MDLDRPRIDPSDEVRNRGVPFTFEIARDHGGPVTMVTEDDDMSILGDLLELVGHGIHRDEERRLDRSDRSLFRFSHIEEQHGRRFVVQESGEVLRRNRSDHLVRHGVAQRYPFGCSLRFRRASHALAGGVEHGDGKVRFPFSNLP